MPAPLSILKQHFGYDAFRPLQEEIITTVLQRNDVLALLPTGGGKSVCYQVPAMLLNGITLVISPLIALMNDQVSKLKEAGIPAACIHSGMHFMDTRRMLQNCLHGAYKLLYISPERLHTKLFREFLEDADIDLIAIDEAHCVSQWGHDFRPDYLKIAALRERFQRTPFLCLTASATPDVCTDIATQLKLEQPFLFRQSFDRPNLLYKVRYTENKPADILTLLRSQNGTSIVYCRSRKQTEIITRQLINNGIPALAYHAGMEKSLRDASQGQWMNNEVRTMVATTAFGMGIDKPDVRLVLHYDAPEHLEAWYQEAGRAGRDGKNAETYTLFNHTDINRLQQSTELQYPPVAYLRQVYQAVCEYLQLPIGVEPDKEFDFDLADFCKKFSLEALPASNALKLLERQDLWTLNDGFFHPSTAAFLYSASELQDLYKRFPDIEYFCTGLLRLYGTVFQVATPVRETMIAKQLKADKEQVIIMLHRLHKMEVIEYIPANDKPKLLFHSLRVASDHLLIDTKKLSALKKRHEERTAAMIAFLEQDNECRSKLMLQYFGELSEADCRHCDVCLSRQIKNGDPSNLQQDILNAVHQEPGKKTSSLATELKEYRSADVYSQLRILLDEGLLYTNEQDQLFRS